VPIWLGFLLTLTGALLLATTLTRFVERPAMRALRRWYRARSRPAPRGPDRARARSTAAKESRRGSRAILALHDPGLP
jgi:peptidoglycan/LPS O-acetylase OafA/YrhL